MKKNVTDNPAYKGESESLFFPCGVLLYGIITTSWLLYLRIKRFLRNRRNPLRIRPGQP